MSCSRRIIELSEELAVLKKECCAKHGKVTFSITDAGELDITNYGSLMCQWVHIPADLVPALTEFIQEHFLSAGEV